MLWLLILNLYLGCSALSYWGLLASQKEMLKGHKLSAGNKLSTAFLAAGGPISLVATMVATFGFEDGFCVR